VSGDGRTVVMLEEAERGGLRIKLVGWPRGTAGPSRTIKLDGLPRELDSADAVERYGRDLMAALRKQRELRAAVDDALLATPDEVRPLCFVVDGTGAEQLYWEMLWEESEQFLALNPRWPIGRIAGFRPTDPRLYRPPLQVLAVMSALGEEARPEWLGLRDAVADARGKGLAVHLTAVVGEQSLLDELRETAEAEPGWLTVVALESKHTLRQLMADRPPHILHVFCHGRTEVGVGQLELATIGDRAEPPGEATASVLITVKELADVIHSKQLWLVTLNCCSGAQEMADVQSIAHSAVAAGAAAAVGWREAVDARDANLLCSTLYSELLDQLARRLTSAAPGDTVELELATSSWGTRDRLRSTHGTDPLRWTLPVTYLAPNPLSVVVIEAQSAVAGPGGDDAAREAGGAVIRAASRASALSEVRSMMTGAPPTVMQALGARIAAARAGVSAEAAGDDG
jgi:hypothetical protein